MEEETIPADRIAFWKLVKEIVNDDRNATRFIMQAGIASELYRKIDKGIPYDKKEALTTLEFLSTEWLTSPFVRQFYLALAPSIVGCLEKYKHDPNSEHCPLDVDLLTTITYLFRGNEGVDKYMPMIRELSDKLIKERKD